MIVFEEELKKIPILKTIQIAAENLNYNVYAVGGYVRDLFLGKESKDIDFTCEGEGIVLAKEISKLLGPKAHFSYFKNFGTAMINYEDYNYEFVGARKESYQRDSRKPITENGTLSDDLNRRDLTINAMALKVNETGFGTLLDPFQGIKDLNEKRLKTPLAPAQTFSDDPLRMIRVIRFANQLDFDIAPETFEAISKTAPRLSIISMERIIAEVNKIVLCQKPSYGFKLMFTSKILIEFFPEFVDLYGVDIEQGKKHKDNFYHTLEVLDNIAKHTDNLWLRWAAILHDIAKPATKRFNKKVGWTFHGHEDKGARMVPKIFKKLKLPLGESMKFVQKLVLLHLRPIALINSKVTDSAVRRLLFEAGEYVEDLMLLCRADITTKNEQRVNKYLNNFKIVEKKMIEVEKNDKMRNFQPVITGDIIMKTFDIAPSRLIGTIKVEIREAILEGKIKNTHKEAFPYMIMIGKKYNLVAQKLITSN